MGGSAHSHDTNTAAEVATSKQTQEWALHQLSHAMDYAVGSRFWLHASNGLNLQTVHHLFPQVGWGHYPELSQIVAQVCAEFDLTYNTKPSIYDAFTAHYTHLTKVNDS